MKKKTGETLFFYFLLSTCLFSKAQTQHSFLPSQANPLITLTNTTNYAYINDTVPKLNKLFLFLPGSLTAPAAYLEILQTAANLGYHAIGLTWVNSQVLPTLCVGHGSTCVGLTEEEEFFGGTYSAVITIDSADAIRTRLINSLTYLNSNYPTEGWGQYLAGPDSIIWTSVCVSGHSQGAAIASHIAYWYLVDRAVFFATGGDWYGSAEAAWMDSPSVTPPLRKYAFTHMEDERYWLGRSPPVTWAPVIWGAMSLYTYGSYINFDTLSGNYYGGHTFTSVDTNIPPSTWMYKYHDCVVEDIYTPVTISGSPTYLPLWQYMLTDSSAASCTATVSISNSITDTICSHTVITFNPVITNGGTAPGYQWYLNGSVVSTTTSYNDSILNKNDSVWVVMTSNAACASPKIATSNKIAPPGRNTNGGSGTWTWRGTVTANWFEACNWDKLSLPDALSDVIIPGGTANEPTITGATGFCKTLTINTTNGAILTVATSAGGLLDVAQ